MLILIQQYKIAIERTYRDMYKILLLKITSLKYPLTK